MYDDLYCKVFIDAELSYEELFSRIINYVGGKKESFSYVVTDWCDMFIQKNKEYNYEQYLLNSTDFLYWKYYLDIEPLDIDEREYIKNIINLLSFLRECCKGVVIACEFEEEVRGRECKRK